MNVDQSLERFDLAKSTLKKYIRMKKRWGGLFEKKDFSTVETLKEAFKRVLNEETGIEKALKEMEEKNIPLNHVTLAYALREQGNKISLSSSKALLSLLKKTGMVSAVRRTQFLPSLKFEVLSYIQNRGRLSFRRLKEKFEISQEKLTNILIKLWSEREIEIEEFEGIDREKIEKIEETGKIPTEMVNEESKFIETWMDRAENKIYASVHFPDKVRIRVSSG